jgi:3-oxoacyl-[acyl-carrier protein] reductase
VHNVLLSGATRGLGLGIARRLVADGHRVIGLGRRNSADFEALRQQVGSERLEFLPLDLADTKAIHVCVQDITQRFGPLYGLVNNAALGLDGVLATMHNQQIRELVEVNVIGTIILTKYACRTMLVRRAGRIVNISSIIAATGFSGLSVYAATKAALNGFARSLARELGRANITVNSVAPGYMETDMTSGLGAENVERICRRSPMNRLVAVDEVAAAVAFLMSDAAAAITGTVITVDAGSTA